jgi:hypothetical protein
MRLTSTQRRYLVSLCFQSNEGHGNAYPGKIRPQQISSRRSHFFAQKQIPCKGQTGRIFGRRVLSNFDACPTPSSGDYHIAVMHRFIEQLDFADLDFDIALRCLANID